MSAMSAMILAAGRGERLRPLTQHLPKPLVAVQGRPVIEHTLIRLAQLGIRRVVINACYLADALIRHVGDGSNWGLSVVWSHETRCLDTGGGVVYALPHVGEAPFLVINGDILWTMDLRPFLATFDKQRMDALLGVVQTPAERSGDFLFSQEERPDRVQTGRLERAKGRTGQDHHPLVTYTGIQLLRPQSFSRYTAQPFSLNRFYDDALRMDRLRGFLLHGRWADIGTPERLAHAQKIRWTSEEV